MANPVITACPAGQWTKIATNVTAGQVHKIITTPFYLQTYRDTGQTAPTAQSEGVMFSGNSLDISASAGIDVYIWAGGAAGSVRVDL